MSGRRRLGYILLFKERCRDQQNCMEQVREWAPHAALDESYDSTATCECQLSRYGASLDRDPSAQRDPDYAKNSVENRLAAYLPPRREVELLTEKVVKSTSRIRIRWCCRQTYTTHFAVVG